MDVVSQNTGIPKQIRRSGQCGDTATDEMNSHFYSPSTCCPRYSYQVPTAGSQGDRLYSAGTISIALNQSLGKTRCVFEKFGAQIGVRFGLLADI